MFSRLASSENEELIEVEALTACPNCGINAAPDDARF